MTIGGLIDEKTITRKGEYLARESTPVYCAEVLMQSIANSVKDQLEAPQNETPVEAIERFKLGRDYMRVLDYMMAMMEQEVMPALKRLHDISYPNDKQEGNKHEPSTDNGRDSDADQAEHQQKKGLP